MGSLDSMECGIVKLWNSGIVEWATMTNNMYLLKRAHYAAQLEHQKGERKEQVGDVDLEKDREAKATEREHASSTDRISIVVWCLLVAQPIYCHAIWS